MKGDQGPPGPPGEQVSVCFALTFSSLQNIIAGTVYLVMQRLQLPLCSESTANRLFSGQGYMNMSIVKVSGSTKWWPELERA